MLHFELFSHKNVVAHNLELGKHRVVLKKQKKPKFFIYSTILMLLLLILAASKPNFINIHIFNK